MNISSVYRIRSFIIDGGGRAVAKITLPKICEDGEIYEEFNRFYLNLANEYFDGAEEFIKKLAHGSRVVLKVDFRVIDKGSVSRKHKEKPYVFIERRSYLSVSERQINNVTLDIYDIRHGVFKR